MRALRSIRSILATILLVHGCHRTPAIEGSSDGTCIGTTHQGTLDGQEPTSAAGSTARETATLPSSLASAPSAASAPPLTLVAGGDIDLGRAVGKQLLRDATYDPFRAIQALFQGADVVFANLESPLSEQGGETGSPGNNLVFTGPPVGAEALARAGFHVVSTANNHAWDYGKRGLLETLSNLDRVGIAHAGTGLDLASASSPAILERGGLRIAFLAATDVWNQGILSVHPARDHVVHADPATLESAVRDLRRSGRADIIVVSVHGGEEYREVPHTRMRRMLRAAINAGADAALGHHPHVPQGIEIHDGHPIFYSLGNLRMAMHSLHPETGLGLLARITFRPGQSPGVEVCPFRQVGPIPIPLRDMADMTGDHAALERASLAKLRELNRALGPEGARMGALEDNGCATIHAR